MRQIEKLYCISMKDEKMRRSLMIEQLDSIYKDKYEMIEATTIEDEIVNDSMNNLMSTNQQSITALSQIAICYSHKKCIERIYENKLTYGGIIEDDIRLPLNILSESDLYLRNNPELLEVITKEPCIIHICGPPQRLENLNKYDLVSEDRVIVNICFYVINYQFAKILLENFYPITTQFDTYVYKMVKKYKVKEYQASPILCWDLSSIFYERFWDMRDRIINKNIKRLSNISPLVKSHRIFNLRMYGNDIYNKIFMNVLPGNTNIQNKNEKIHYLCPLININEMNEKSIIIGSGILSEFNSKEELIKPLKIFMVRGRITGNYLKYNNIEHPEYYADPLILYLFKLKKNNDNKKINNKINKEIKSKYTLISTKNIIDSFNNINDIYKYNINNDITKIIDIIMDSYYVISNNYIILLLSTLLSKKVLPLIEENNIFYKDFLTGFDSIYKRYNIMDLKYYNIDFIKDIIMNKKTIYYPEINKNELDNKINFLFNIPLFEYYKNY